MKDLDFSHYRIFEMNSDLSLFHSNKQNILMSKDKYEYILMPNTIFTHLSIIASTLINKSLNCN